MSRENNVEKKQHTYKISLIFLILIIVICIGAGIFIGAFTPIIDFVDNIIGSKEVTPESNYIQKNNIEIRTENAGDKEVVFIKNNNSETVYGIELYAMFYGEKGNPLTTETKNVMFVEAGEEIAKIIECYDENGKLQNFANCIVDVQIDENSKIGEVWQPLERDGNKEKYTITDITKTETEKNTHIKYKLTNTSLSKCASMEIVTVYYKDGKVIYATKESVGSFMPNKPRELVSGFGPKEYDEVKMYIGESYKYSYR